LKGGKTDQILV